MHGYQIHQKFAKKMNSFWVSFHLGENVYSVKVRLIKRATSQKVMGIC